MRTEEKARFIIDTLKTAGFKAFLVGGCVRDTLLGKTPHDWDLTTDATPEEILSVFKEFKTLTTGIEFGTIVVMIEGEEFEVTTFRTDAPASDKRHPDFVTFAKTLEEDLKRRDFTICALAFDTEVIDLFGGVDDLKKGIIRCVGVPEERFEEDALRILRALRFASTFGFTIEEETAKAIHTKKHLLVHVTKERVTAEFLKFMAGKPVELLREFRDVFAVILPEIVPTFDFEQLSKYHKFDVWEHTLHTLDDIEELDVVCRVALLFHDIGKPSSFTMDEMGFGHFYGHPVVSAKLVEETFKRDLRTTKEFAKEVLELVELHDITISDTKAGVRRAMVKMTSLEAFERLLVIKRHDMLAHSDCGKEERLAILERVIELKDEIVAEESCFKLKDLKIKGTDVMALGVPEGKEVGRLLKLAFETVIDGKVENEKTALIEFVKGHL